MLTDGSYEGSFLRHLHFVRQSANAQSSLCPSINKRSRFLVMNQIQCNYLRNNTQLITCGMILKAYSKYFIGFLMHTANALII